MENLRGNSHNWKPRMKLCAGTCGKEFLASGNKQYCLDCEDEKRRAHVKKAGAARRVRLKEARAS